MIRSMTAFAGSDAEIFGVDYGWEIRSVNHRFLDINMRIPENLRALEGGFRALVAEQLKRGKIDCTLNCRNQNAIQEDIRIDRQRLDTLIRVMREIEAEFDHPAPCSALQIMALPGVLIERKIDPEILKEPIGKLLRTAVLRVVECREREGVRLADIIADRCRHLEEQIQLVRLRLPEISERFRAKLHARLAEISTQVDPVRFEQEIVFLLQKLDIDEEIERLAGHIVEVGRVLLNENIAGRRLDFLLQEMNREANTLGSKSLDSLTTQACVSMKVLIEQMREQVQNIE